MARNNGSLTRFLRLPKKVRRFKKNEDGVAAVEFAMLAGPFFLLLFAIIETSLHFFAGQVMESGADTVARMVRTGQLNNLTTETDFKNEICDRLDVLFSCDELHVELEIVAEFDDLDPPENPTDFGTLTPSFDPPEPAMVAKVTVMAEWPVFTNYVAKHMSDLESGNALLSTVIVFKTEPWPEA